MALSDIRISAKVNFGFGAVLALLGLVGIMGYNSLGTADDNFQTYRGIARETNSIGRIQANVLKIRLDAKDFLINADEHDITNLKDAAKTADAVIAELLKDVHDPDQINKIKTIDKEMDLYTATFDKVADLRKKENDLTDNRLGKSGPELEKALTALMDASMKDGDGDMAVRVGTALRDSLIARLYAQKFLIAGSEDFHKRVLAELNGAGSVLGEIMPRLSGRRLQLASQAQTALDAYITGYAELHATNTERRRLVHEILDKVGPKVADLVEAFKLGLKSQQDELGPRASAAVHSARTTVMTAGIIAFILGIGAAFLIGRGITGPVNAMTRAMGILAGGDTSVAIPATGQKDEIGEMAQAVQVFKDNAIRVTAMQKEQEEAKARAEAERRQAMLNMADNFEAAVMGLVKSVAAQATEMQATAQGMSAAADQGNAQASTVAAAAEQATANVQTVAAAAEELSSSISEISRQVAQAAQISKTASDETARTNTMVQGLAAAADKIGEVVNLINDIASQTNLLALNATIEAARAGDAGKGFAVVANEVKNLANQTGRATEEISNQIGAVQEETRRAVEAIGSIGTVIEQVRQISSGIASAVEEQGAATQEIARNVQQAAQGTQEVSSNIGGVSEAASSTGAAANDVLVAAGDLSKNSEKLSSEVNTFLSRVRTG
ncbi:Methyl-accepting chemotaxis protein [Paramagnetospirillum magnetotacticum MS-1]|uniref:Methyl-accepting chemotaxis protein n=1 Tax=Paramagnetospirillum magnetotacticum MS-1 TaxID=272627 RepID=A0A0C2V303_PARME|nr:methyl-accepting chemotaxis protein [Paramagnetospirillum magnetotacticum]KIL99466.1 Methyl-accepting chemotaxis protein [Paramagnetospirillum magnetotacticum MS-1]